MQGLHVTRRLMSLVAETRNIAHRFLTTISMSWREMKFYNQFVGRHCLDALDEN